MYDDSTRQPSTSAADDNERHSIQTYLSDMLALERHIQVPLARQREDRDAAKFGPALNLISQVKAMSDSHIAALEERLSATGGHAASPIKSAWASFLGAGAAAIDSMRKTRISKDLRDDSTALSLAAISYTMLHTTALGLGDAQTASLAKRHLSDIAPLIMNIGEAMPEIVLAELVEDGENVDTSVASVAQRSVRESWRNGASDARESAPVGL